MIDELELEAKVNACMSDADYIDLARNFERYLEQRVSGKSPYGRGFSHKQALNQTVYIHKDDASRKRLLDLVNEKEEEIEDDVVCMRWIARRNCGSKEILWDARTVHLWNYLIIPFVDDDERDEWEELTELSYYYGKRKYHNGVIPKEDMNKNRNPMPDLSRYI